jgi:phosphoglucomutase
MKEQSLKLAKSWANNSYFDQDDRNGLNQLLSNPDKNEKELIESFYKDLEFGTGGLRAEVGFGSNRMNKYNVRKATQAMVNICKKKFPNEELKACVSYDCRRFSPEFAKEVCSVYAANGIKAFLFNELTPTPLLSYAVRYYKAQSGVMITASHNPKQYNGFKAYWDDGGQVTPPVDGEVIAAYGEISDWSEVKTMDFDEAMKAGLVEMISDEVKESFFQIVEKTLPNIELSKKKGSEISFIYTPLHGTGYIPCKEISERLGYKNFHIVEEQANPDSEFSTVKTTPNPEDPVALEFAVKQMLDNKYDIAYGTDPDCDRLGVVVNHNNQAHYLNGNQIAFLMLYYLFKEHKDKNTLPTNPLVIKSIVTSPLQKSIVEAFGGTVLDTLTGFKWMAQLWRDLEEDGTDYNFFFASEESFGYMPHNLVRDKDAITAMALMNEVALYFKLLGKTLIDALDEIYDNFGYAQESLIALNFEGIEGKEKINRIMDHFRNHLGIHIADERIAITKDFLSLKERHLATDEENEIKMVKSNVLGFQFESGNQLFVRPSGTEPKIKFYTMVKVNEGELQTKKRLAKEQITNIENFIHKSIENI